MEEQKEKKQGTRGRNKTTNKHIVAAMGKVNQAIRENKKISFRYQKFIIKPSAKAHGFLWQKRT